MSLCLSAHNFSAFQHRGRDGPSSAQPFRRIRTSGLIGEVALCIRTIGQTKTMATAPHAGLASEQAMKRMRTISPAILACLGLFPFLASLAFASPPPVALIADTDPAPPAQHGLAKLSLALAQKGIPTLKVRSLREAGADTVVVAGLESGAGEAARLIGDLRLKPSTAPESLLIRKFKRDGKTVVLVAGADARGLMYALAGRGRPGRLGEIGRGSRSARCARCAGEAVYARAGSVHLHVQPRLLGEPVLRRGLLGEVPRLTGPESL